MSFYMPTRLYAEEHCLRNHGKEIGTFGRNALIVTGRHSAVASGALADITAILKQEKVKYLLFDQVEENPSIDTVMKAAALGIAEGVDFVIGIGGGSPMDVAKAVAVMIAHPEADWHYLYEGEDAGALPVICIPTTCGTGSEVTGVSVLTNPEAGTKVSMKHRVFPALALLDGRYLKSASVENLRNTAIDALCHAVESYLSTRRTAYSKVLSQAAMELWAANKGLLLALDHHELSEEEALDLLNASAVAGMAIAQAGTVLPHALSYHLTYAEGIPHGKACGYFLANYIRGAAQEDVERILKWTGFESVDSLDAFYKDLCGGETMDGRLLEEAVEEVFPNPKRLAVVPYPVDKEVLKRIAGI